MLLDVLTFAFIYYLNNLIILRVGYSKFLKAFPNLFCITCNYKLVIFLY